MDYNTVPTITITLVVFSILSMTIETSGEADISNLLQTIDATFNTT